MANKLTDDKIRLIAENHVKLNYNRVKTLLACGYSENYANNVGLKLFDNSRVIEAIMLVRQQTNAKVEYNKSKAEQMLLDLLDRCVEAKDRSNEVAVLREMNTINALRIEVSNNTNTNIDTAAVEAEDKARLRRIAEIKLSQG